METIIKTLKWTIICNISQLNSQALDDKLHTTDAIGPYYIYPYSIYPAIGRLKNKVAIKVIE